MPDISMCRGTDCIRREQCYRHKATPSEFWQSYFVVPPFLIDSDTGSHSCRYFWPLKEQPVDVEFVEDKESDV